MNVVGFVVRPRADLQGVSEIVPTIDDVELTDLIHTFERHEGMETRPASYGGLIPAHFDFGPLDLHYLGNSKTRGGDRVPLLGCSCGEWGCWPLLARIASTQASVSWSEFEQPYRKKRDYSRFGPFRFVRAQYERALAEGIQARR